MTPTPPKRTGRKRRLVPSLLLPFAASSAEAIASYREILEPHPLLPPNNDPPPPLSDLAVAASLSPTATGDLAPALYLLGGCRSDSVSYHDPSALDGLASYNCTKSS